MAVPQRPAGLDAEAMTAAQTGLLHEFLAEEPPVAVRWYSTPMMLAF